MKGFENSVSEEDSISVVHDKLFFDYKHYSRNYIVEMGKNDYWVKSDGDMIVMAILKEVKLLM